MFRTTWLPSRRLSARWPPAGRPLPRRFRTWASTSTSPCAGPSPSRCWACWASACSTAWGRRSRRRSFARRGCRRPTRSRSSRSGTWSRPASTRRSPRSCCCRWCCSPPSCSACCCARRRARTTSTTWSRGWSPTTRTCVSSCGACPHLRWTTTSSAGCGAWRGAAAACAVRSRGVVGGVARGGVLKSSAHKGPKVMAQGS